MEEYSPLILFGKRSWHWYVRLLGRASRKPAFRWAYAAAAAAVLLVTTVFWAVLGARLQNYNADQLSDPYLFSSWATFHAAVFPGTHSFLLKWPIFWLLHVIGATPAHLVAATVAVVVTTVAALAFVLYRIDRRPLVFGTMCLGLSLVLLLVPAQPYAGGILPVNMAMLTTRNLEYAVYLAALVLFARARRLRDWGFAGGVLLLALLVASDKLFLSLSAGGALLALVVYALRRNQALSTFAARWLTGSLAAAALSAAGLWLVSALHLTHLANSAAATPYGVIHSGTDVALGGAYAVLGFFTNLGANPAYASTVLGQLPGQLGRQLWSWRGPLYAITLGLTLYALTTVWRAMAPGLRRQSAAGADGGTDHDNSVPATNLLALALVWSTVAALGVFVATSHYFAVDARYLTIALFALTVCVSVRLRGLTWSWPEDLPLIATGLIIAIALAVPAAAHISAGQTAALRPVDARNRLVEAALQHHKVDVLVGDYWRVLPIKLATGGAQIVEPLANCTRPTATLTSGTWQPNLATHSFAYLVTLDRSLTGFPACSLSTVTARYGRPNAVQVIAGTPARPTEVLLFYDQGAHPSAQSARANATAARTPVLPIGLADLPNTGCMQPTIMNVVAHQDDDLLFLSPDLLHEIRAGDCIRTVFVTAGDAGSGKFYWLDRQLGSEAAYSTMLGLSSKVVWDQQTVKPAPQEYVTIATPRGHPQVSLIFFNLPDGNLQGQGFATSGNQSLAKLAAGTLYSIRTVDGQSTYTSAQLTTALSLLMSAYHPAAVHTQADVPSDQYPDHSDHVTTGRFTEAAAAQYDQQQFGGALSVPVIRYVGYPIHGYPANLTGAELTQKEAAFLAYGHYDGGVCHSVAQCTTGTAYGFYLPREYRETDDGQAVPAN